MKNIYLTAMISVSLLIWSDRMQAQGTGTKLNQVELIKCLITSFDDISNPEKATFKIETEFKSPEMFIQKTIVNNKITKTDTFNRVKN